MTQTQSNRLKHNMMWVMQNCIPVISPETHSKTCDALLDYIGQAVRDAVCEDRHKHRDKQRRATAREKKMQQYLALDSEHKRLKKKLKRTMALLRTTERRLQAYSYLDFKPPPAIPISFHRLDPSVPAISGVYFGWDEIGGQVIYVGQSINLRSRVTDSHAALVHCKGISWIPVPETLLNWTECFYIGILHPRLNFGGRNSHREPRRA